MRKVTLTAPRVAMLGAILTMLLSTSAIKADPVCSQATMSGTYVTYATGKLSAGTTGVAEYASVGTVNYDGHGHGTSSDTQSVSGVISRTTSTATYTVKPDCTGSKDFEGTTFDFVITSDGREIFFIVTNAGTVVSGHAVRLDNRRN